MKEDLLLPVVVVLVWNTLFVVAVALLRRRAIGRALVVLGVAAAGASLSLISLLISSKGHQGGGGEPGFGAWVELFRWLIFVGGPLALVGACLGTWVGVRWSREVASRIPLAVASAVVSLLVFVAIAWFG